MNFIKKISDSIRSTLEKSILGCTIEDATIIKENVKKAILDGYIDHVDKPELDFDVKGPNEKGEFTVSPANEETSMAILNLLTMRDSECKQQIT